QNQINTGSALCAAPALPRRAVSPPRVGRASLTPSRKFIPVRYASMHSRSRRLALTHQRPRRTFRPLVEGLEDRLAPNASPLAPPITEPVVDGQIINGADVHMQAGPFSDPDTGDTHTASDWELWTTDATPQRVWHAAPTTPTAGVLLVHIHL